eukprot:12321851-Alexandrium_andersonii.AAC.1
MGARSSRGAHSARLPAQIPNLPTTARLAGFRIAKLRSRNPEYAIHATPGYLHVRAPLEIRFEGPQGA